MSVTFYVSSAKKHTTYVPCDFTGCSEDNRCGYCNDGIETKYVSDSPEVNVSNVTARILLSDIFNVLDYSEDLYGEIEFKDIPNFRRKIILNLNRSLFDVAIEPSEKVGESGCKIIDYGVSEDLIILRLKELDQLMIRAQEVGSNINYS